MMSTSTPVRMRVRCGHGSWIHTCNINFFGTTKELGDGSREVDLPKLLGHIKENLETRADGPRFKILDVRMKDAEGKMAPLAAAVTSFERSRFVMLSGKAKPFSLIVNAESCLPDRPAGAARKKVSRSPAEKGAARGSDENRCPTPNGASAPSGSAKRAKAPARKLVSILKPTPMKAAAGRPGPVRSVRKLERSPISTAAAHRKPERSPAKATPAVTSRRKWEGTLRGSQDAGASSTGGGGGGGGRSRGAGGPRGSKRGGGGGGGGGGSRTEDAEQSGPPPTNLASALQKATDVDEIVCRDELASLLKEALESGNLTLDEIKWRKLARSTNTYQLAERRIERLETKYFRIIYEASQQRSGASRFLAPAVLSRFEALAAAAERVLAAGLSPHPSLKEGFDGAVAELRALVEEEAALPEPNSALIEVLSRVAEARPRSAADRVAAARARLEALQAEAEASAGAALGALEEVEAQLELWRGRRENAKEYAEEVAREQREFLEAEAEANGAALRRMRALLPVDIGSVPVEALKRRAAQQGEDSFYTTELATRLKSKLLEWCVTHPEDIARANFLQGSGVADFTSLQRYDIVELRAIAAVLPETFKLDADGKKAAWRSDFIQHLKGVVQQHRGDLVPGGWDPVAKARQMVPLPPLAEERCRAGEYFFPTDAQIAERREKLEAQLRRLEEQAAKVAALAGRLEEAKGAFDKALADKRDPEMRSAVGKEALDAQFEAAKRARKAVEGDVRRAEERLKRLEATGPAAALEGFDADMVLVRAARGGDVRREVPGGFDESPAIKRRARALCRKMTAEEEATARKQELEATLGAKGPTPAKAPRKPAMALGFLGELQGRFSAGGAETPGEAEAEAEANEAPAADPEDSEHRSVQERMGEAFISKLTGLTSAKFGIPSGTPRPVKRIAAPPSARASFEERKNSVGLRLEALFAARG